MGSIACLVAVKSALRDMMKSGMADSEKTRHKHRFSSHGSKKLL
jgi:hypothetical protein